MPQLKYLRGYLIIPSLLTFVPELCPVLEVYRFAEGLLNVSECKTVDICRETIIQRGWLVWVVLDA
jgi:hypothetical protein